MEFTLLGAVLIAVAALYAMLYWEAKRGNAADCTKSLWDIALTAVTAGVFVGRLWAMAADGVNPLTHIGDILIVRAGVSTGPAALTAVLVIALVARSELLVVADGLAAAALAGLAGWHAGCLVRDACLGTSTDLPWAFAQEGSTITRHPVELYAAALLLAAAMAITAWKQRGRPVPGVPAALALAAAGAIRLVTEPFRPALSNGPVWWYWAAVVAGVAAAAWATRTSRQRVTSDAGP